MGLTMDNISKVLAGVIGIAGILAFLTPSEVSFTPVAEVPAAPPTVATLPPVPEGPPQVSAITDEDLVMGQPTIDGNPIVDGNPVVQYPNNNDQNSSEQPQQAGGYVPQPYPGYTMPQGYGMQPQQQQPLPGNEGQRPL